MDSEVSVQNFPRTLLGILAVASVILILDIPIAFLVGSYLRGLWFFANRPVRGIFSDLLFLEGIGTLAIGLCNIGDIRLRLGSLRPGYFPIDGREWRDAETRKGLRKELEKAGVRLLIISAIFIGVSLLVAFLPL
jgi:hypothetical protein